MIFEPFSEKLKNPFFQFCGLNLKVGHLNSKIVNISASDENFLMKIGLEVDKSALSSILGKKWIYYGQHFFHYLGAQNWYLQSPNLDENLYAYHCCVELLGHKFSAKFHKSYFSFRPKTDFGLFLTVF